jgi:molecular chaperone GrpE
MSHHDRHRPGKDVPPGEPSPQSAPTDLQKQLEAKAAEARDLLDQLQRVAAEYSNYQKRMERHLDEERQHAVRALVLDLLPALDNFDRALASAKKEHTYESLLEGVTLVHNQLLAALARHGVTPAETPAGATFDPEHHEAVACLPSPAHPQGAVVEEMQKGYRLHGRTIRPARVVVSDGKADAAAPPEPKPDDAGPPA